MNQSKVQKTKGFISQVSDVCLVLLLLLVLKDKNALSVVCVFIFIQSSHLSQQIRD